MGYAIEIANVWKKYKIGQPKTLTKALPSFLLGEKQKEFWALKNINFKVKRGETVGIIGLNGSGKSTLLKILAGITKPTKGFFWVDGKLTSLLELGTGFQPELTGRENIYLYGSILGLNQTEITEKFREIVHFSEVGKFLGTPLKHYSSGMQVRLAFSIAVNVKPDILLIDEVFAVGDASFQEKGLSVIKKFKNKGITMAIASHDLEMVKNTCDRVLLLNKGKVVLEGNHKKVIPEYLKFALPEKRPQSKKRAKKRWGDGEVKIIDIWVEGKNSRKKLFFGEEIIRINLKINFLTESIDPIFGIIVKNEKGISVFESNTRLVGIETGRFKKGDERMITWELPNYLDSGQYSISPAVAHNDGKKIYDWREDLLEFKVKKPYQTGGVLNLNHDIKIK